MIDSDIQGADGRLAVQFYIKPMKNEFMTEKEGRPIFEDVEFVKIFVPGDSTLVIDTFAREEHKKRFPMQYAHFKNMHGDEAKNVGTPITQWPLITASQAEELKALKYYTVESVATASDAQLQRIGMIAGMSPHAFRDRAIKYLKIAKEEAGAHEQDEKIKALEAENAKLKAETDRKLAEMQEQMAALIEARKPGRKPREQEAA